MGVLAVFPLYYQRAGIVRSSLAVGLLARISLGPCPLLHRLRNGLSGDMKN
jgi:hypothetical protein